MKTMTRIPPLCLHAVMITHVNQPDFPETQKMSTISKTILFARRSVSGVGLTTKIQCYATLSGTINTNVLKDYKPQN